MAVYLKYTILGFFISWLYSKIENEFFKALFGYAFFQFLAISFLMFLGQGEQVIGKNSQNGQIPLWSWILYFPFHLSNYVYMYVKKYSTRKSVPAISHIVGNYWVGSWFHFETKKNWRAIVDLTNEFPERGQCEYYLQIPVWDGNPPTENDIHKAIKFIEKHEKHGPVLIHCAFGVGRSFTVLCAALVSTGKVRDFREAIELGQSKRNIARLNHRMYLALQRWEAVFAATKKISS